MKFTNKYNLPLPLCRAIEHQAEAHSRGMAFRSCTELIDSPLVFYLNRTYWDQIEVDYSQRLWMLFGSIAHTIPEKFSDPEAGHFAEFKLSAEYEVDGEVFYISGTSDHVESSGRQDDYKFTSVYSGSKVAKDDWISQQNVYRSLMLKSEDPVIREIGEGIKEMNICAMLRDWSIRHRMQNIPPVVMHRLPMWTPEDTEEFIKGRIRVHRDAERSDNTPACCTEKERWISDESYAVMKQGVKRAKKLFKSEDYGGDLEAAGQEAQAFVDSHKDKDLMEVVLRKSEPRRCQEYCDVARFCPYFTTEEEKENQEIDW